MLINCREMDLVQEIDIGTIKLCRSGGQVMQIREVRADDWEELYESRFFRKV